jgi:hypothetical protein
MATASAHPQFTPRFWERYGSDELIQIRTDLESVIDHRARQFSLFEPAAVIDIAQVKAIAAATAAIEAQNELGAILSPSQARCFLSCQARWWFKYAVKLPDPINAKRALGNAVHRALETNFRAKLDTKEDLSSAEVVEAFESAWDAEVETAVFDEDDVVDELAGTGRGLVTKFMDEAAEKIAPAAIERRVEGEIAGVKVCGYIDLLDTFGRVIDLKTAAKKPGEDVDSAYAFQIATYRQLPIVPIETDGPFTPQTNGQATVYTMVKTKKPQLIEQSYEVSLEDQIATQKLYPMVQAGIRHGLYLPNRKDMMCSRRNCNYWRECQAEYGGKVAE